jgi:hypothetical protein
MVWENMVGVRWANRLICLQSNYADTTSMETREALSRLQFSVNKEVPSRMIQNGKVPLNSNYHMPYGTVTVVASRMIAVCASSLPLIDARFPSVIDV